MSEPDTDEADVSPDAPNRWYTVSEAAEYLGVSEPTIFRWMREGRLSFYKVGGSTRFSREGLDALIEKTTGSKEAESAAGRCAACGHSVLVEGGVQGAGRIYFHPDKTRFWVFAESLVPIRARVCTACGHIQLQADTAKLKRLLPKDAEAPDKSPTPDADGKGG
jgi:excisionase family DNA binding protein